MSLDLESLLERPAVNTDQQRIAEFVRGKAVLVTGGGGSIGSEICRRLVWFGASRLTVADNSEPALCTIMDHLSAGALVTALEGCLADVRDRDRVFGLMREAKPDLVFHAAALKQVPVLERDWREGVKTNVFGSVNVADAAVDSGVGTMVMVSTDKAADPVSVLGATKRLAEAYCHALDRASNPTRLISVRFGNVLGTAGSVVPKFQAQIEAGGPVTVTHPDMVRYFMTVREACDLVITAASHAAAVQHAVGSTYVLEMGQPVRILDLAQKMVDLSGEDVRIEFTGIRPGERLNEILFAPDEPLMASGMPGIMMATPAPWSIHPADAVGQLGWHVSSHADREAAMAVLFDQARSRAVITRALRTASL